MKQLIAIELRKPKDHGRHIAIVACGIEKA
jgi:hypothetical protein